MSVQTEINRIKTNIASAYSKVSAKGGTLPSTQNSGNLATAIDSITIQKYYTGSSDPSSSLGQNGDLYLKA